MNASDFGNPPDHLARYGLFKDPFAGAGGASDVFETSALVQRVELIQHLVEFGNQMILVTGEPGSGKTTLLRWLYDQGASDWRTCLVTADPSIDGERLLRELCAAFELQHRDVRSFDVLLGHVKAHINSSERSMLMPVLLVDDAHALPLDALKLLLGLNLPEPGEARLRSVLFCEPSIQTMLAQPQLKRFREHILHRLDIPAFDAQQTRDYVHGRLRDAGLAPRFRYNESELERIYRASGGLPGRINVLARQALLDGRLERQRSFPSLTLPRWSPPTLSLRAKPWQLIAGAAIVGLVLAGWWVRSLLQGFPAEERVPATVPLELPPADAVAAPPQPPLAMAAPEPPGMDVPTAAPLPAGPPPTPTAPEPEPSAPSALRAAQETAEPLPPAGDAVEPPPAAAPPAANQAETRASRGIDGLLALDDLQTDLLGEPPPATAAAPAPVEEPPRAPGLKGNAWFREQPRDAFVLQLLGAHDAAAINRFVADNNLQSGLARFATRREDRPWFVLVYGLYSSREEAQRAVASLPPVLARLEPWPRQIASIVQPVSEP